MTTTMGISPSGMQASAAVFNVDSVAKAPPKTRDDFVAPIDTNSEAAKNDLSFLKMARPNLGQNVDVKA